MRIQTIEHYMAAMRMTFSPERAQGQRAVLQYAFTGRESGTCHAIVADGTLEVAVGPHATPTVAVHVDFDLWMAILAHEVDGLIAYQEGQYTVGGDLVVLLDSNAWFVR
ncbi:MAG: hypothetical protein IVW57_19825 [Ktedonobacterales bacterium]|nr:hypothetical protein [Ktedonobacterales bacterium]